MPNIARENPFPVDLCAPTSRRYSPGVLPKTAFEAQNGATSWVHYGRQYVNARLELGYANISDDDAAAILRHYEGMVEDDFVTFISDDNKGFAGMSDSLKTVMQSGNDVLRWHYDGPPQVTSVRPGLSSVQCRFIGYLYAV